MCASSGRLSGQGLRSNMRRVSSMSRALLIACALVGCLGCDRGAHAQAEKAAKQQSSRDKISETIDKRKECEVRIEFAQSELGTVKEKIGTASRELAEARDDEVQILADIKRNQLLRGMTKEALHESTPVGVQDPTFTGYQKSGFKDIDQSMHDRLEEARISINKKASLLDELGTKAGQLEDDLTKLRAERDSLSLDLDRLARERVNLPKGKK